MARGGGGDGPLVAPLEWCFFLIELQKDTVAVLDCCIQCARMPQAVDLSADAAVATCPCSQHQSARYSYLHTYIPGSAVVRGLYETTSKLWNLL